MWHLCVWRVRRQSDTVILEGSCGGISVIMLAVVTLVLLADMAVATSTVTPAPVPAPTADLVYDGTIVSLSTGFNLSGPLYAEMAICGEASFPPGACEDPSGIILGSGFRID